MTFAEVFEHMKNGAKAKRESWLVDKYIVISHDKTEFLLPEKSMNDYYKLTARDMFAEDWCIFID